MYGKKDDTIWNELRDARDYYKYYGLPEDFEKNQEEGFKRLRRCCQSHGISTVLEVLKKRLESATFTEELFYFAKAGIIEIAPELRAQITSAHSGNVARIAVGLAYLGLDDGFNLIESLSEGAYPVKIPDTPRWHFACYLEEMNHPRAKEILKKIQTGEYN